jgi:hypothetical protein
LRCLSTTARGRPMGLPSCRLCQPYSGSVQFCTTVSGEVLAWSLTVFIRNR